MKRLFRCIFVIILVFQSAARVYSAPELNILNDGPSILDSNITFYAELKNYEPMHLTFIFDDGIQKQKFEVESLNLTVSRAFPSNLYKEDTYFMNITVQRSLIFTKFTVVANFSKFELRRNLIGAIDIYRGDAEHTIDVDEVAIGENVSLVLNLVDHSGYLDKAAVDYSWSIDYEKQISLGNTLIYNFTDPGIKDIKAIATASFPNNDFKFGYFERKITAKVPVKSVNISGNPFIYHGDFLNLNISCDGTPPFIYCYEIFSSNTTKGNFTCKHLSTFTTCHMEIVKYFQKDGTYNVGIYISNNVREVKRVIEVIVYSVPVHPTLSLIIVPIVCSLLTLIIIAFGISYYVQQRNKLAIEVANFDFQEESDSYTERTFFENILDSFSCRRCTCYSFTCDNPGENEPLV